MRLRIISLSLAVVLISLLPQWAEAQIASSNPLEWAALAEGNELINGQIEKQIKLPFYRTVLRPSSTAYISGRNSITVISRRRAAMPRR